MKRVFNKNDWKRADGASPTPKRLKLEPDEQILYVFPVENCESDRYKSQSDCRKHVFVKHGWYYYSEKKQDVRDVFPAALLQPTKKQHKKTMLNSLSLNKLQVTLYFVVVYQCCVYYITVV